MKKNSNNVLFTIVIAFVVVVIIVFYLISLGKINWLNLPEEEEPLDEEKRSLHQEIQHINKRLDKLEKHIAKKVELKIKLDKYVNTTYWIIKCFFSILLVIIQILFIYWCYDPSWKTTLNDVMNINEAIILVIATASLVIYGKPLTILNVFNLLNTGVRYSVTAKFERHFNSIETQKGELISLQVIVKEKSDRLRGWDRNKTDNI